MKNIIIIAAFSLLTSFESFDIYFAFNIYQAAQDGGAKAPLEKITASLPAAKGNKTETSTVYEIPGSRSSVRIKSIEALFKTSSDNISAKIDPATVIQLFQLAVSKNKRTFSLVNDSRVGSVTVPISFQPEDYLFYKIILSNNLASGEYAFIDKTTATADGKVTVFAFGID